MFRGPGEQRPINPDALAEFGERFAWDMDIDQTSRAGKEKGCIIRTGTLSVQVLIVNLAYALIFSSTHLEGSGVLPVHKDTNSKQAIFHNIKDMIYF